LGWTLSSGISTRGAVASGAFFLLVLSFFRPMVLDTHMHLAVASPLVTLPSRSDTARLSRMPHSITFSGVTACPWSVSVTSLSECDESSACRCLFTSSSVRHSESMTSMTSLNILHDTSFDPRHRDRSLR
ncbi:hypothetical protein DFH09DRAFT_1212748, partial [Mycena vulgaris]